MGGDKGHHLALPVAYWRVGFWTTLRAGQDLDVTLDKKHVQVSEAQATQGIFRENERRDSPSNNDTRLVKETRLET